MFERFVRELDKYDPGIHRLYPPASLGAIRRAEEKLGIRLPRDYVAFLRRWNGGLLFAAEFYDLLIWSVDDESLAGVAEYNMDIAERNIFGRATLGHPAHLLAIASYSHDNLVCLDMSRDGRPVMWLRYERLIESEWANSGRVARRRNGSGGQHVRPPWSGP